MDRLIEIVIEQGMVVAGYLSPFLLEIILGLVLLTFFLGFISDYR